MAELNDDDLVDYEEVSVLLCCEFDTMTRALSRTCARSPVQFESLFTMSCIHSGTRLQDEAVEEPKGDDAKKCVHYH